MLGFRDLIEIANTVAIYSKSSLFLAMAVFTIIYRLFILIGLIVLPVALFKLDPLIKCRIYKGGSRASIHDIIFVSCKDVSIFATFLSIGVVSYILGYPPIAIFMPLTLAFMILVADFLGYGYEMGLYLRSSIFFVFAFMFLSIYPAVILVLIPVVLFFRHLVSYLSSIVPIDKAKLIVKKLIEELEKNREVNLSKFAVRNGYSIRSVLEAAYILAREKKYIVKGGVLLPV